VISELLQQFLLYSILTHPVSAKDEVQDLLIVIIRKYINQGVELHKVEF
jgi:hypothetical protein